MIGPQSVFGRKLHDRVRNFYFNPRDRSIDNLVRWVLAPLTGAYALARSVHQNYRFYRRETLEIPVISIGNISIGGTGKTPFVSWLIDELTERDIRPGVLKRGEGETSGIVPEGIDDLSEVARQFGDEVTLLRHRFPEVPIFAGSDRVEGARRLQDNSEPDLILLDDGFQYRCLHRDLDVVLLRPTVFHNNWQLPSGPLREPLSALGRADFISLYGLDGGDRDMKKIPSGPRNLSHHYEFSHVERDGRDATDEYLRDEVILVTTLARPGSLAEFLDQSGFSLKDHISLPDHSKPNQVVREGVNEGDRVLVTAKEWVKLPPELREQVGVVRSRLKVEPSDPLLASICELTEDD